LAFFRQAIALDPHFAPGHYGYALALQWDIWHFSSRPFVEVQEIARGEAQIALSLDDKDATAHAVLAHMMMWGSEWEAAIAQMRTAIALNPNSAFVISMLGCVLGFGGFREEALERLQQALRASPHGSPDLALVDLAWSYSVLFTRFHGCASVVAPSCSPASGLRCHLPIHCSVACSSQVLGRGAHSARTCPPAVGGAA
jgi:tetratricopeptide (TPR) repeat protein